MVSIKESQYPDLISSPSSSFNLMATSKQMEIGVAATIWVGVLWEGRPLLTNELILRLFTLSENRGYEIILNTTRATASLLPSCCSTISSINIPLNVRGQRLRSAWVCSRKRRVWPRCQTKRLKQINSGDVDNTAQVVSIDICICCDTEAEKWFEIQKRQF